MGTVGSTSRDARPGHLRRRFAAWSKREFAYPPFLALLLAGVLLRVGVMALYYPGWLQSLDSLRFARIDPSGVFVGMFDDYWMPAGYALYISVLQELTPALWVTIAAQHLLGVALGVFMYLSVLRLTGKQWLACLVAAVPLLSGDQLWMEHQIMSEPFLTLLIAAGLFAAISGLVPRVRMPYIAVASGLLMCAGLSRNIGLAVLPVLVLCVVVWGGDTWRRRGAAVLSSILPALLVFGLYLSAFAISDGRYLGLVDMSGWNTYARTAPFADCTKFTPPPGTAELCESTPPAGRPGPFGYQWDPTTAGRSAFALTPDNGELVGGFGKQALVHQPLDYLEAVAIDAARYIDPSIGAERPFSGLPREVQSFGLDDPSTRAYIESELSRVYTGTKVRIVAGDALDAYQRFMRIEGLVLLALAGFTLMGICIGGRETRLGCALFGLTAFVLYLVPVATLSYEVRYGIPPQPFLAAAGLLGLSATVSWRAARSRADKKGPPLGDPFESL